MILWLLFAALLQGPPEPQTSTSNGALIAGFVINAADNRPIARASVLLIWHNPATQPQNFNTSREAITDEEGRFAFPHLEAATYGLIVEKNGYLTQQSGQKTLRGSGVKFELKNGEQRNDLLFRMTPAAAITGKIRDERGDPAVGLPVRLRRPRYNANGGRYLENAEGATTDDRGEYRIYGIVPGQYYLAAGPSSSDALRQDFAISYFPSGSPKEPATPLEVTAGSQLIADFNIAPAPRYSIKGHLTVREGTRSVSITVQGNSRERSCPYKAGGNFECSNLLPGRYTVRASQMRGPNEPIETLTREYTIDAENVEGGDFQPGRAPLAGRVLLDDKELPSNNTMQIQLTGGSGLNLPRATVRNAEFEYPNLEFGVYRVSLGVTSFGNVQGGLPPGTYLKEIRLNDKPVVGQTIAFSGKTGDRLEILLSSKVGQIQGRVTDDHQAPVNGASVILIPNDRNVRLYRSVVTPKDGQFALKDIPPGDYEIYSWESIEEYQYFDSTFVDRWRERGTMVHLDESSAETVNLQVLR